jgi:spore coat protein JB
MNKDTMLEKLMELDFMAVDLQLYLDTHPNCSNALAKYNETICQSTILRKQYEEIYGPLYSFRSEAGTSWRWNNEPWPWQYQMNFEMTGEEKHYVDL